MAYLKTNFFIFCKNCNGISKGKPRVKCSTCQGEFFFLKNDPNSLQDIYEKNKLTGKCESCEEDTFAEFYFKCTNEINQVSCSKIHQSSTIPLLNNVGQFPNEKCMVCWDDFGDNNLSIHFGCDKDCKHYLCLSCFQDTFDNALKTKAFVYNNDLQIYTLVCPGYEKDKKCQNILKEVQIFKIFEKQKLDIYKSFSTEALTFKEKGVICPLKGCTNPHLLPLDPKILFVKCPNCKGIFCRSCNDEFSNCFCKDESNQTNIEEIFHEEPSPVFGETPITLFISSGGKSTEITVYPSWTVRDALITFSNKTKTPYNLLKLIYFGKNIDQDKKINEFDFRIGSTVNLLIQATNIKDRKNKRVKLENEYIKKVSKECPGCKTPTQHLWGDGCHHMKCNRCSLDWCYICLIPYQDCKKDHEIYCDENCGCPRSIVK